MEYEIIIVLSLFLPLASFLLLGLFGRKVFGKSSGIIATSLMLVSVILALKIAFDYFGPREGGAYESLMPIHSTWLKFSEYLSIDMSVVLDPISVMMLVVVTFVSLMVHIFSLGYMKGEERFSTYYAFLGLFTFSMLGLVVSANLFQIYIFWELVGVSSYLLIGFYYDRPSAVSAAKKAFVVTRFADLGFLIGILILAFYGKSLDIRTLIDNINSSELNSITTASFFGISALTWGLTLIFVGGAGKSAMFPLHIWLPDAMEGPTPVSALIHAATMVVAGVYLIARLFPLFVLTEAAMSIVTFVGLISAFLAAIIACTQTDIKRVLAYSTMSQIGYMMFALGISHHNGEESLGYTASMFHLFTHAFFKSLLFLCAGAVIHLIHSNEIKDMGGLRKYMPITHITFLIACLAIAGIPPFAGFFSKEEILLASWRSNKLVYGVALITSGLTAFYMFRLYFSIFWNKQTELRDAHGEGTISMKLPLIILAICTAFAGFIPFGNYVSADGNPLASHFDPSFSAAPVAFGLAGVLLAMWMYKNETGKAQRVATSLRGIYQTVYRKFYIDEIYLFVTKRIIFNLVARPAAWIDRNIVDGTMNGIAWTTGKVSEMIKGIQSGKVQSYALYFFGGIIALTIIFLYVWK